MKIYMAYKVNLLMGGDYSFVTDKHLTMTFMDVEKVDYISMYTPRELACRELDVQYWSEPDITVITVGDENLKLVQENMVSSGWLYETGYEFRPHITMCKGDQVDLIKSLLVAYKGVKLTDPYLKVKSFDKN